MSDANSTSLDEKAHSTILLSLSDEVLYEVADEETAAGVWKKLEKLYMTKSLTNKLLLKQRMVDVKMMMKMCSYSVVSITSLLRHQDSEIRNLNPLVLSFTRQDRGRQSNTMRQRKRRYKDRFESRDLEGQILKDIVIIAIMKGHWKIHVLAQGERPGPNQEIGFKYTSENGVLRVSKGALVVMKATKGTSSLYTLQGETITSSASVSCTEKSNSDLTKLWHMRLGHMSEKGMVILSKRGLLDNHKVANLEFCEHCVMGKQKRVSFSKAIHQTKGTLDYLHADCWGPSRVPSLGGARYFLSIIDDFSRMTWVFMMKHKSEAFEKFKHWKILIENQTGRKIKRLRTDNGLEFCSREFEAFCRDEGIVRHYTVSFTLLNKNGVDYSKLRVFGCPAYYHVSDGKLNPRANKGIFMGYGDGVKGYRIWSPSERRVILSRDVTFDEDNLFRLKPDSVESKFEEGASEKVEHVAKQVEYVEHEVPEDTDHDVTSLDPPNSATFWNKSNISIAVAEEVESLERQLIKKLLILKDFWNGFSRRKPVIGLGNIRFKARLVAKGFVAKRRESITMRFFSPVISTMLADLDAQRSFNRIVFNIGSCLPYLSKGGGLSFQELGARSFLGEDTAELVYRNVTLEI
ncbi:retrovirus-related pol polyprotein from transposon TNT 1-94 [Tanacetum coccineum]